MASTCLARAALIFNLYISVRKINACMTNVDNLLCGILVYKIKISKKKFPKLFIVFNWVEFLFI